MTRDEIATKMRAYKRRGGRITILPPEVELTTCYVPEFGKYGQYIHPQHIPPELTRNAIIRKKRH